MIHGPEIIPAILAYTEEEFRKKVALVAPLGQTVQIDVMDGIFVANRTWADSAVVGTMKIPVPFEAHLMVADPLPAAIAWIAAGAARIIPHVEADGWQAAVAAARAAGREAGVAVNPDTPLSAIESADATIDCVLVMGVTPGWSGQAFNRVAIDKVATLRKRYPALRIEVDGGVSLETAGVLARAGATALIAASALFSSRDILESYTALERAATVC